MRFAKTCLEAIGYALPENVVSSTELEQRLAPLYERLHLPEGRLELMSGIVTRRFWKPGTLPSVASARAGEVALAKAGVAPAEVQCLIHCSVSRDFVEPATSTAVHRLLGLGHHCLNFDISNACLGMASGVLMLANMIELGQIDTGLAVCGENAGPLVENTVERLNADLTLTRRSVKDQFASLTIGSCAAAIVVRAQSRSRTGHRLLAAANWSDTSANELCQGDANGGMVDGSAPLMATDSQALLHAGVEAARHMWEILQAESGWVAATPDVICTHQVGKAHSRLLFETLGLSPDKDFVTYPMLGTCGSASWPVTCAMAEEQGVLHEGANLALLGIGSGLNCTGMAVKW